jgi:hypothetical protein
MGIENCTNQGPSPFQMGENHKNARAHIYMKAFSD